MKRILSVLLAAVMLLSLFALPGMAEEALPESAHEYENNFSGTWEYTYPKEAEEIYVTFSKETYFDPGQIQSMLTGEYDEEDINHFLETGYYEIPGDVLYIYYKENDEELYYGSATGDMLAGKSICIPGNWFKLVLETDKITTAYGFAVTNVGTDLPDDLATVNYHEEGETVTNLIDAGEEIKLNPYYDMRQVGKKCIVGWKTADGVACYYDKTSSAVFTDYYEMSDIGTGIFAEGKKIYDLYPIYADLSMTGDEVFSFTDDEETMTQYVDGNVITDDHLKALAHDWFLTFGFTPFMPDILSDWEFLVREWAVKRDKEYTDYNGASGGFVLAALMQHYGKIDMLSLRNARSLSALKPTESVLSTINFYQMQVPVYYPTCHLALRSDSDSYSDELKALWKTVQSGKPVYFEYFPRASESSPLEASLNRTYTTWYHMAYGKSVLFTGAYTDADGNHMLIAWDCENMNYANGYADVFCIDPNFTYIEETSNMNFECMDGFAWNDDVSALDSFKPDDLVEREPLAWHKAMFKNLTHLLTRLVEAIRLHFRFLFGEV